jgi:hypothetical protein
LESQARAENDPVECHVAVTSHRNSALYDYLSGIAGIRRRQTLLKFALEMVLSTKLC